jgi:hypothetical protein
VTGGVDPILQLVQSRGASGLASRAPYRQSRWVVVDGGSPVAACTRWCVAKPCATAFTVAEGDVVSV